MASVPEWFSWFFAGALLATMIAFMWVLLQVLILCAASIFGAERTADTEETSE